MVVAEVLLSFLLLVSTATAGVVVLNDENFEHLTQASTGATTGDWFIKVETPFFIRQHVLVLCTMVWALQAARSCLGGAGKGFSFRDQCC